MRAYSGIDLTGIEDPIVREKLRIMDRALRDMSIAISSVAGGDVMSSGSGDLSDETYVVTSASTDLSAEKVLTVNSPLVGTVGASTVTLTAPTVVVGPASATADNVASYDGTTGKLVKDSGKAAASVVTGPASVADGDVAIFSGTTGKALRADVPALNFTAGTLGGSNFGLGSDGTYWGGAFLSGAVKMAGDVAAGGDQFISTVGDAVNNTIFDFRDGWDWSLAGALRSNPSFVKLFRIASVDRFTFNDVLKLRWDGSGNQWRLVIGETSNTDTGATFFPGGFAFLTDAAGTAGSGKVTLAATSNSASLAGATGVGMTITGLDGSPRGVLITAGAASDTFIEFRKSGADGATANDTFLFVHSNATVGGSRRLLRVRVGTTDKSFINQAGRWGTFAKTFGLYKDDQATPRWQRVDGLQGGGFGGIDAGTTEPTT